MADQQRIDSGSNRNLRKRRLCQLRLAKAGSNHAELWAIRSSPEQQAKAVAAWSRRLDRRWRRGFCGWGAQFGERQAAARSQRLDAGKPFGTAKRFAARDGTADQTIFLRFGFGEEFAVFGGSPVAMLNDFRRQPDAGVGFAAEMGSGTGEDPVFRVLDQMGAAGVEFDVAQRGPEVLFVDGRGVVAGFEQMAGASGGLVEVAGPPGVEAQKELGEGSFAGGDQQEVDVVGHEAVSVKEHAFFPGQFIELQQIGEPVAIVAEEGSSVDGARHDVVSGSGDH
jgi:hypothetical protein